MRILYYFPEKDIANMTVWQRVHFIEELTHYGVKIDTFNPLLCNCWEEANEEIIRLLKGGHYDLFFTGVCQKECLFSDTLTEITRIGIPSLCIRFDNLVIPFQDRELSPFFSLVWLTSIETKRFYDKWGAQTCFAPYAANPYTFSFKEMPIQRRLCFAGTPYGSRLTMINILSKGGVNMTLYYGKSKSESVSPNNAIINKNLLEVPHQSRLSSVLTRLKFREGHILINGLLKNRILGDKKIHESPNLIDKPSVYVKDLQKIYSEYALSLASTSAHHTDVLNNPLKIVNLRSFEIPMSGGIEICRYNQELARYYEEDKEILFYRSNEELVDKARYYTEKATDQEIFTIKRAARKRSENEHTWYHRFSKVLNNLELKI